MNVKDALKIRQSLPLFHNDHEKALSWCPNLIPQDGHRTPINLKNTPHQLPERRVIQPFEA